MSKITRPPGPKGQFIFGVIPTFSNDPLTFLLNTALTYGDIAYFRLIDQHIHLISHPDYIREILVTQAKSFEKSDLDKRILGRFLGNGLVTSDGEFHKRQRRLAQPAFHIKRITAYAEVMVDFTQDLLNEWQAGQTRDIADDMMRLTMYIVSKTLFDADVKEVAEKAGRAVHDMQEVSNAGYKMPILPPYWLPTPNNRKSKRAVTNLNGVIDQIIAERRGTSEDKGDLLSMLMLSQDEDGTQMTDQQLRDEVVTLFAAGHETTSNLLSWTWYLLSEHPDIEDLLHEELDSVLAGRTPTLADLRQLPYTLRVLKETMRLYPPAWILNGRTALEDVEIGGYQLPKGSQFFISPYVMHHLPQYFPDPERFDPERWLPENEATLPKYTYIPFGGGARVCIGTSFAMMEAHLILATIAQKFTLTLEPNHPVVPNPLITMSPKFGLQMQVQKRVLEGLPAGSHQPTPAH